MRFSRACGLHPEPWESSLALYYERLSRWPDAIGDLDCAIALEPDSGEAHALRARCKHALGDEAGARADLERAAALGDPEAIGEPTR